MIPAWLRGKEDKSDANWGQAHGGEGMRVGGELSVRMVSVLEWWKAVVLITCNQYMQLTLPWEDAWREHTHYCPEEQVDAGQVGCVWVCSAAQSTEKHGVLGRQARLMQEIAVGRRARCGCCAQCHKV